MWQMVKKVKWPMTLQLSSLLDASFAEYETFKNQILRVKNLLIHWETREENLEIKSEQKISQLCQETK